MTTSRPEQAPPGLRVGGYELLTRLGEGGMGVVHLARRPGGQRVALKVLRPHIVGDDEARSRLAREVSSLSRISSRWIAEIVDADPWGDIPYVATRYVPGLSLHDHVHEEGPLTGADLTWFASCLTEGVAAVHAVGVLHRDIKPSNVLMEGRTPILIDFGLARVADDPRLTHTGWLLGTPGYLAPEILHGEDADEASDVHSWAATVAYAGTGRAPFGRGPSMAIMDRVRRGEHDLSGLDHPVRALVEAALDPDPAGRPTLDELRDRVARLAGDGPAAGSAPDPFTMPLAVAATRGAGDTTAVVDPEPWQDEHWQDEHWQDEHWQDEPARPSSPWDDPPRPARGSTRVLEEDGRTGPMTVATYGAGDPALQGETVGALERVRRGVLTLAAGGVVAGAVVAAPYLALAVVALTAWLLRSGSLAASAVGDRRRLRGVKWYDAPQLLLATPWHLLAAIPGAVLLVGWGLGLGLAVALLCFAVSLGTTASLALVGTVFTLSLWWGPGSRRFRSPVQRVLHPLSARGVPWFLGTLLVLAGAAGLASIAGSTGTDWTPDDTPPFADVTLPAYLQP